MSENFINNFTESEEEDSGKRWRWIKGRKRRIQEKGGDGLKEGKGDSGKRWRRIKGRKRRLQEKGGDGLKDGKGGVRKKVEMD